MNAQVVRELACIPRGDLSQSLLRVIYQMLRAHSLGANAEESLTVKQTLDRATAMVRVGDDAFVPHFDAKLLAS